MTRRPIRFALGYDDVLLVPQRTAVTSRKNTDLSTTLAPGLGLAIPLLSANTPWCTEGPMASAMALAGGLGVLHRASTPAQQTTQLEMVKNTAVPATASMASVDGDGRLRAAAAVGVTGDWKERAAMLVDHGADALVVDVAHGHADYVLTVVAALKKQHPNVVVIGGNVATVAGTRDLIQAGADVVKVGIGPGGICTTRLVAGAGVPQLTAVINCADEAAKHGVCVIADGGIKNSGDLVKALAAGATTALLGSALAGADESPARLVEDGGHSFKVSTGFVTHGMQLSLKKTRGETVTEAELDEYLLEGVEGTHEATGTLERTLHPFLAGLRSGLSYSGAANLEQLRQRAAFVQISAAGVAESLPHALGRSRQLPLDFRAEPAQ
ncbi:IMP dehydrogenase [Streptomyces misionensis]|uniref:IMP dehydrogenase n=1 Tax=Streptomyces misionensis TaxID=67331 RepID=A0A5C6J0H9_9ACTN|nr:IMP dehydrogenase [Streptomyces misionensis]TWV34734.1 IMP dehydrogenase [Streptomyces misionensis]